MKFSRKAAFLGALLLAVTTGAAGQFGHPHPEMPKMPTMLKPVVGSGAEYQFTEKGKTADFSYAVVGKEPVSGNEGYWLEIRISNPKMNGEMVMKELMTMNGSHPDIHRLIMQPPGRPAMEMPSSMIGMMRQHMPSDNGTPAKGMGKKIGTETITVPAGTFDCTHYRTQQEGSTVDLWISDKVSPYGVVKMVGSDTTMVLQKILTHQTSHIKGTPQKIQMPHY